MLTFEHVTKSYLGKKALSDVSVNFEEGRTYALAGPNGSGKSTLMKSAAGLVKPAGRVALDGVPIGKMTKAQIAYMSTEPFYYDYMNVRTVETFYADFYADFDAKRFETLLKHLELTPDMKVKALSSGMAAKLKVAATLSRRARVVMLDEPFNGIDVLGRDQIREAILRTGYEGRTLIMSSHLLDELESIVDDVVMIKKGEIAVQGSAEALREEHGKSIVDLYKETFAGETLDWGEI